MIGLLWINDDLSGKSKMQKIKIITKTIKGKMAGDEKEARACLEQLLALATSSVPPLEDVEQKPVASRVKTEKQFSDGGPKQENWVEDILNQLAKTKSGPSWLRREFRISGQIGEPGQTEKLTFVSLMHQIDSGLKRDYQENEIVVAVIRAISPLSSLRINVETPSDLSLAKFLYIMERKQPQKYISNWQPYANKAINPHNSFSSVRWICVTRWILQARSHIVSLIMVHPWFRKP